MKRINFIITFSIPLLIILVTICGSCIFHPLPPFNNPNDPLAEGEDEEEELDPRIIFQVDLNDQLTSSTAVGLDGTIYVGSSSGVLFALNSVGDLKWEYSTSANVNVKYNPVINSDNVVYFGAGNFLYAINPDGSLKWKYPTIDNITSPPAISTNGTIYVGCSGEDTNHFFAITPDGSFKWDYSTPDVYTTISISSDEIIHFSTWSNTIYALNDDGSEKWTFVTASPMHWGGAIDSAGNYYTSCDNGNIYAIDQSGNEKWVYGTGNNILTYPSIGPDEKIYIGSQNGTLLALNSDGTLKWNFQTLQASPINSTPAIAEDGTLFFTAGNYLFALNSDKSVKWYVKLSEQANSNPVLTNSGIIYITAGTYVYAIEGDSGGPANSPWPMYCNNAQNSGKQK